MARTAYNGYVWILTLENVLQIRRRIAATDLGSRDFGAVEPLSMNLVASAVARQDTGFEGRRKYERPHEVAATLFYGLATNHGFENGNKRTALVSCLVSLEMNERDLVNTGGDDLYQMATAVVDHRFPVKTNVQRSPDTEVQALASWIRSRTRKQRSGDHIMHFRDLKEVLEARGCSFELHADNFIKIRRGTESVKTGYPRENFTVPVQEIKRIRNRLGLDNLRSQDFYDLDASVDAFVAEHRDVLWRLADA
jgi:death-on-curing family protein